MEDEESKLTNAGLLAELAKASLGYSWYDVDETKIANEKYGDIQESEAYRRAIHSISNYRNTLGVYRSDFDKKENDTLAKNAYYALCEKAVMDYISFREWSVNADYGKGERLDRAYDFLYEPNPQEEFADLIKMIIRDVMRYDAGVWVKSFNKAGYLTEMKSYLGTEFWKEIDIAASKVGVPYQPETYYTGYWSRGFTRLYWQRSQTGVYVSYQPEEIVYMMMYPRSDNVYGTDFLQSLKYQLQYLIDSTRAAGKTFENGIVPSLVWSHPDVYDRKTFYERIQQANAETRGSYKFGGILHTVNDEDVKTISSTLHDMEWLAGQRFVAQIIWAMWGFSASEFVEGDTNRATAYVKRNITKSRMLTPILKQIERKINREVLPYLKGYKKDWRFSFSEELELDDENKVAMINAQRATTFATYINTGMSPKLAMKLAGIGDDLSTDEEEELEDILDTEAFQGSEFAPEGDASQPAGDSENEQGRYSTEDYSPINFSDYGNGTAIEDRDSKKDVQAELEKGKVYIGDPKQAPSGAKVGHGSRGGYYYVSGQSGDGKEKDDKSGESFRVKGKGIDVYISHGGGKPKGHALKNSPSQQVLQAIFDGAKDSTFESLAASAKTVAQKRGLTFE